MHLFSWFIYLKRLCLGGGSLFLVFIDHWLNNCFVMDGLVVLLELRPPGWILVCRSISVNE